MPARAGGSMPDMSMGDKKMSAQDSELTDAEVKRIDAEHGMVTLKHGALENVGMAPMTMAFKARDRAMVESLHAGDRGNARGGRVAATLTIVRLVQRQ
nr:copper-binding protein [Burkholderia territorii]